MRVEHLYGLAVVCKRIVCKIAPRALVQQGKMAFLYNAAILHSLPHFRIRDNRPPCLNDVVMPFSTFAKLHIRSIVKRCQQRFGQRLHFFRRRLGANSVCKNESLTRLSHSLKTRIIHPERDQTKIVRRRRVICNRLLRFTQQGSGLYQKLVRQRRIPYRGITSQIRPALGTLQLIEILFHERRRLTVETTEKLSDKRLNLPIRIPHQLSRKPSLQLRELRMCALVVTERKQNFRIIVAKESYVFAHRRNIRKRHHIIAVIRHIVPDVKHSRLRPPLLDIATKRCICPLFAFHNRLRKIAAYRTKAWHDIFAQFRLLRRFLGIKIGKRFYDRIGELAFRRLCNLIYETHHRTGMRFLLRIYRRAIRASAKLFPIVLADAKHPRRRVIPHPRQHVGSHDCKHVRIGQAQLRFLENPLASDHTEILWIAFRISLRRQQCLECMAIAKASTKPECIAAVFRISTFARPNAIHPKTRGKITVLYDVIPIRNPYRDGWLVSLVQISWHGYTFQFWNHSMPRRIPSAPGEPFENFIHAIKRAASTTALYQ